MIDLVDFSEPLDKYKENCKDIKLNSPYEYKYIKGIIWDDES